ncbi:MAG: undecaprenyl-diphosphate phosphatase [Aquisalinus sp.]|nr:undecaprenyl-diphosphate phosphatase [Aquisalinus sp.]
MPLLQLIILAIVQGITEFIPVSSSAHLILVPEAVPSWADQGPLIDVAVHVGSLGAVMLYFRRETGQLFLGGIDTLRMRDSRNRRLFLMIAAATIPTMVVAPIIVFTGLIDHLRSMIVIGVASIVFGIVLWYADRKPVTEEAGEDFSWKAVVSIGCAQAVALIPGSSRSGMTITAARFLGYSRTEAARFSMLLSIPTILAFGLLAGAQLVADGAQASLRDAAIAISLSFLAAFATIHLFMKMTRHMSFTPFVAYRILLGLALIGIATL